MTDIPSIPEERLSDERLNELVVDDVSAITASWLELQKIARELQSRRSPNEAGGRGEDSSLTVGDRTSAPSAGWRLLPEGYRDRNHPPFDGSNILLWVGWLDGANFHVGRYVHGMGFEVTVAGNDRRYPKRVTHWQPLLDPPTDAASPTPVSVRHDKEEE